MTESEAPVLCFQEAPYVADDDEGRCFHAVLDGRVVLDKSALLRALAEALRFPAYFGANWDALLDCLGDLSWLPSPCCDVVIEHAEVTWGRAPRELGTLSEIAQVAAKRLQASGRSLRIIFVWSPS